MQFRSTDHAVPQTAIDALAAYREYVRAVVEKNDTGNPEGALALFSESRDAARGAHEALGNVSHVVLIGIGGSSLGTEAVHEACRHTLTTPATLHVLDAVSETAIDRVEQALSGVALHELALVIISKSGSTTETITNASLLLSRLASVHGDELGSRVVVISDAGSDLSLHAEQMGYRHYTLPHAVGGRYSVFSPVGTVPLALLGYDIDLFLTGARESLEAEMGVEVSPAVVSAHMLATASERDVSVYDTFVFDTRLRAYGLWRRQLLAESLGKTKTRDGRVGTFGVLPTVSTAVDLHSVAQLYLGGFRGIHTDFVILGDYGVSTIPDTPLLGSLSYLQGKTTSDVDHAIWGGVRDAYREQNLPFNIYEIHDVHIGEIGALMAHNMLETMYAAELMGVNAFDQPHVELYKTKTRALLNTQ